MSERQTIYELIERARRHVMTDQEREAQRRSFAYSNAHLDNPAITRADIDHAAEMLAGKAAAEEGR
jgi:hypothetical protein